MKKQSILCLTALIYAGCLTMVSAQSTGTVLGTVKSAYYNENLSYAKVQLSPKLFAITDKSGAYRINNVPAGTYDMTVLYLGNETIFDEVTVNAGAVSEKNFEMEFGRVQGQVVELDPFVIETSIAPDMRALNNQKNADNIMNIVSSDSIGAFPDKIVSDALSRIPGVTVQKQRGEGRDIIIRGMDQTLTSINIDGVTLQSNRGDGRSVSLDIFTLDQLASIEVTKAITADMPGDSIGGYVNLVTKNPLDYDRRYMTAYFESEYSENAEDWSSSASFSFYDTLGNTERPLGVGLTVSYQKRSTIAERLRTDFNSARDLDPDEDGEADYERGELYYLDDMRNRFNINERERFGVSFTLAQDISDTTRLTFKAHYNKQDEELSGNRKRWRARSGRDSRFDYSFPFVVRPSDNTIIQATNTASRGRLENSANPLIFTDTSITLLLAGVTEKNDWKLDYSYSFQQGRNTSDEVFANFRMSNVQMSYIVLGPKRPVITAADPNLDVNDPTAYELVQNDLIQWEQKAKESVVKVNFSKDLVINEVPVTVKTGFYLSFADSFRDYNRRATGFGQTNFLKSGEIFTLADPNVVTFLGPTDFHGIYDVGILYDSKAWSKFTRANIDLFSENEQASLDQSRERDWNMQETVTAVYLQGQAKFGKLSVAAGVRYEYTDAEATRPEELDSGEWRNATGGKTYDNFLPSVHFKYAFSENFLLRASYNRSLRRPLATDFAGERRVSFDELEEEYSISGSDPDLKAFEADNFDLQLEYYTKYGGIISAGVFHKNIDGFIFTRTREGEFDGFPATFSTKTNASSGDITGVELNVVQNLIFLPAPFSGLGFNANVTLTDSSIVDPDAPNAERPFFKQSDLHYNVSVDYGYKKFNCKLSYQYRDPFLLDIRSDPNLDRYFGDAESLDFKASFALTKNWIIEFAARNLTDDSEDEFQNNGEPFTRLQRSVLTGIFYTFGVRWRN